MPLHLTKVAFGAESVDHLAERLRLRGEEGPVFLTTRYLPKRHEEVAGQGSMFWILKHQLIARSPILGFGEAEGGRAAIHIDPKLVLVQARPKRAHQGWRYLEDADAPLDLGGDATGLDVMPPALMTKLAELALI
ncbi:hypothetical protein C8J46_101823 [Sphingomonas sp. PP-F2F-A104-K0414]|uniref:DUF1489 family protein n=1 Tax=Sphingomonas sp. PP-F2F-A104-K0414 TaxID=2135661 RepID=UPI00104E3EE1|nr:DUF1489 domain-containing protein [Sphingomonas sp. PP-F2F-A104-K0414]TCQ01457.1 hypothetical protein C8J46_101823 [Sphingomonas sp. PP-F2F-A104-K0414]